MNPTIPTPPTDNLYKFMALAGIVLLVAAPFYWTSYYVKQQERFHATLRSMKAAMPPSDYFYAKVQIEKGDNVSPERRQLVEHYDAAKKESDELGDEFLVTEQFQRVAAFFAIFLGGLGLVLVFLGFSLWYLRVQRPLDRVLMRETKMGNVTK